MASVNVSLYFEWFRSDWMTSLKNLTGWHNGINERYFIVCLGLKVVEDFRDGVEQVLRLLKTASQVSK
jgi:hypothetical protein